MSLYDRLGERVPIDLGWSGDRKYRATDGRGTPYLLRITEGEKAKTRREMFAHHERIAALGIPMCLPVECGECEGGVYTIYTWVDGVDAEGYIPTLPPEEQYAYGYRAGEILARIHSIDAPAGTPPWSERYGAKIDRKIRMYRECPLRYEIDGKLFLMIEQGRALIANRPSSYQHGDYHIGNMMVAGGELVIIDFDRFDVGDPWEEFNRIVWCVAVSEEFASGMVDGYFDGRVPVEFWRLLSLYVAANTLSSLPWAIPFGEGEIEVMRNQAKDFLDWYAGDRYPVPRWYKGERK